MKRSFQKFSDKKEYRLVIIFQNMIYLLINYQLLLIVKHFSLALLFLFP